MPRGADHERGTFDQVPSADGLLSAKKGGLSHDLT